MPERGATRLAVVVPLLAALCWIAVLLHGAPLPVVALALLPVLAWTVPLLRAARRRGVPPLACPAALLCGGLIAAPLSGLANDTLGTWPELAASGGERWRAVLLAPAVEELLKGIAPLVLLVAMRRPRPHATSPTLAGMTLGAASGLGFAATENVAYLTIAVLQGGLPGLLQATWTRGVLSGVKHALFTACLGAGLGAATQPGTWRRRLVLALAGLAAAVAQHALWNALAAPALQGIVCDAPAPEAACAAVASPLALLVQAPLVVVAALAPATLGLAWVARRTLPGERHDATHA
jgi:RsiW-degrading membrane proteinase PrsW (M82 family)